MAVVQDVPFLARKIRAFLVFGQRAGQRATVAQSAVAAADADHSFLKYLHLFRGIAILQIVFLHAVQGYLATRMAPADYYQSSALALLGVLFHDVTIYFSIISGILYTHVFAARGVRSFYKSRLLHIVTPYVLLSILFTMIVWFKDSPINGSMAAAGEAMREHWPQLIALIWRNVSSGTAWFQLWYMPVVIILYLISPVLHAIVSRPSLRWLALGLTALPLFFPRVGLYLSPSTLLFFVGPYAVGMLVGTNLNGVLMRLTRYWRTLALVAAITSPLAYEFTKTGLGRALPLSIEEGVFYIQKLALAALFIVVLRLWADHPAAKRDAVLGAAASAAFALYFLHAPLIHPVVRVIMELMRDSGNAWLLGLGGVLTFAGDLALTVMVIVGVRLVFRRHSRYLIGA